MKIEFTRAEIEKIILEYANNMIQSQQFNYVSGGAYRDLPDTITVTKEPKE
jgi:hypothetical protein